MGAKTLIKKLGYTILMVVAVSFAVESSAISSKSIRRQITKKRPEFKECYDKHLAKYPRMKGQTKLAWDIDDQGVVHRIRITKRMNRRVDRCLAKVLSEIKFPKAPEGQEISVSYPFVFDQAPFDNDDIRNPVRKNVKALN
jgi:outer membrane biosynthesis protein TonB